MQRTFTMTALLALLTGAGFLSPLPARADNNGVQAVLASRPELSMFMQALHESGVANELQPDQTYTIFAPIDEAFAKVVTANASCPESADCRTQLAAIVRNHIVPQKARIDVLAKPKGEAGTLGMRAVQIENPAQPHDGHKVDGFKIVGMHETETALVYSIDGSIVTERELSALSAPSSDKSSSAQEPTAQTADQSADQAADQPHANAAMAPMIPARPSLVMPPTR